MPAESGGKFCKRQSVRETAGYSWQEKSRSFYQICCSLFKLWLESFAAHTIIASLEMSDGPASPLGLSGLADPLFYSWSYLVSSPF